MNCNFLFGRRILFFCALFFLAGILLAGEGGLSKILLFSIAGGFGVLFFLCYSQKYSRIAIYVAVMFFAMGMTSGYFDNLDNDASRAMQNIVEGTICDISVTESGNNKYKLNSVCCGEERLDFCAFVYTDDASFALGDRISAE